MVMPAGTPIPSDTITISDLATSRDGQSVIEMAKDEARHGRGFEGLLKRYFNTEV